ncbi:MAG: hypothetical protein ACP5I8_03710 [Phycisphaerae bacterium]
MKTVVHVTHEVVQKIGGIGAVLHGLLTSKYYSEHVERNILVGPLFNIDGPAELRLGQDGTVLYSSMDGIVQHPLASALAEVERKYHVDLIYGRKAFHDPFTGITAHPEVLLINVNHFEPTRIGLFKFRLFERFGIESNRYDHIWDYEQYLRIAEPAIDALLAIGCGNPQHPAALLSHEYMGMPTALAARLNAPAHFRTIFYAHEVAPMRRIVESHPGQDITFYNALRLAAREDLTVDDVFGSQSFFYKYPLVAAAKHCDNIFAVGDYVVDELRFLDTAFKQKHIDLAYNGVPAFELSLEEKMAARNRLQHYCETLLGHRPDFVLTHVTRLVVSKGLWRDIRVMEHLEKLLHHENQSAVLLVLSTETSGRRGDDVRNMESAYHWPTAHREGYPDLTGGEAAYYASVQEFNARSRNAKIVYINQFGFDRRTCGDRMPAEMEFMDIRHGSDLEFGQSIYEPFGIAQIEPIAFGGICVFTALCGCAGFVRHAVGSGGTENAIEVDYTKSPAVHVNSIQDCLLVDRANREYIESTVAQTVAAEINRRLPRTESQFSRLLQQGYQLAARMSWEVVARDYVLPGVAKALATPLAPVKHTSSV